MSGTRHLTCPCPPLAPLEPHLALPNRVLGGGVYLCTTPPPCRALLRCDFALRSEAAGCSSSSLPTPRGVGPSSRHLAVPFKNNNQPYPDSASLIWYCETTREGTRQSRRSPGGLLKTREGPADLRSAKQVSKANRLGDASSDMSSAT